MEMVFNQDPTKQAQEVIFQENHILQCILIYFNSLVAEKVETQKYLRLKLDKRLNFREHLKNKFTIVNKGIGMLEKLSY